MITKAQRIKSAKFVGRNITSGSSCEHCNRELGWTYIVEVDGVKRIYGRRCASRILGWATTRVEMEAIAAERRKVLAERREIIFADYPHLRAEYDVQVAENLARFAASQSPECATGVAAIVATAAGEDWWWDGKGWTWQYYVAQYT